jgi:hypothetical protein
MQDMAKTDVQNFRDNVAALCDERGALGRLAANAKISRVFLSKILNGHSTPSLGVAIDISRSVGVSLDMLALPPEIFSKNLPRPRKSA